MARPASSGRPATSATPAAVADPAYVAPVDLARAPAVGGGELVLRSRPGRRSRRHGRLRADRRRGLRDGHGRGLHRAAPGQRDPAPARRHRLASGGRRPGPRLHPARAARRPAGGHSRRRGARAGPGRLDSAGPSRPGGGCPGRPSRPGHDRRHHDVPGDARAKLRRRDPARRRQRPGFPCPPVELGALRARRPGHGTARTAPGRRPGNLVGRCRPQGSGPRSSRSPGPSRRSLSPYAAKAGRSTTPSTSRRRNG